MRTWVKTGYKDFKRGLWGWHHGKMQEASHVERLWLAMNVAPLWTVGVDYQAEVTNSRTTPWCLTRNVYRLSTTKATGGSSATAT